MLMWFIALMSATYNCESCCPVQYGILRIREWFIHRTVHRSVSSSRTVKASSPFPAIQIGHRRTSTAYTTYFLQDILEITNDEIRIFRSRKIAYRGSKFGID